MIRARDEVNGYFRCPTCGKLKPIDEADAGHYITRQRKNTMFDEKNVHAQCRFCNRYQEGNHFIYRAWLIDKYGEEEVKALEQRALISRGYKIVDLKLMAQEYKARTKELKEVMA